ncbi:GNAT family N-acetyltransferase [Cohnella abietis]|uniref:N-acetyltransferase domain-containing protein n=1 Tax=Cohnella abietis TaxID=2507935 RepID=A0A3T1D287_9BACL|nr:GNAT family N-acetyltransferase [Cohnella abietis]BBI32139.1 hypothetical protein KCTCHS21_15380 [Cohnella abietis]
MIRWKQPRDDKGIVDLVRTQLVPISPWQHPRDRRLHNEITRRLRKGATLVIAQSRRSVPLAFLQMEFRYKILFINLLAVHSQYQNRQWGTELMKRAEQHGRKKGCTMARVYVDDNNTRALRFYQRNGYYIVRLLPELRFIELAKSLADEGWN